MLPTTTDIGQRLAAVLPTGVRWVKEGRGGFVLIAVDGLGARNLGSRRGHAPFLAKAQGLTVNTVAPSTTGNALTTLLTGSLPGQHGLIGYRLRHPQLGIRATLTEWEGIPQDGTWQRQPPLLAGAAQAGLPVLWSARRKLEGSGLTLASIGNAPYAAGSTPEERFAHATAQLRCNPQSLCYVYIDELDAAGHKHGWNSDEWVAWLERIDSAVADFVNSLPAGVTVVLTADHGMLDVAQDEIFDLEAPGFLGDEWELGGEPRFVYFYHRDSAQQVSAVSATAAALADRLRSEFGETAWVATREEAVTAGVFGDVNPSVLPRIGDVMVAARGNGAFVQANTMPFVLQLVGQHGSIIPQEREIPILAFGEAPGEWLRAVQEQ